MEIHSHFDFHAVYFLNCLRQLSFKRLSIKNNKQTNKPKTAQLTQLDHGLPAFPPVLWQEKTVSYAETWTVQVSF